MASRTEFWSVCPPGGRGTSDNSTLDSALISYTAQEQQYIEEHSQMLDNTTMNSNIVKRNCSDIFVNADRNLTHFEWLSPIEN